MPNDVVLSKTELYRVREGNDVRLRAVIGDRQVGGTTVRLNGSPLPFDPVAGCTVRGGEVVAGSVLDCTTIVQDVNPQTNHTSVEYSLEGGIEAKTFPYSVDVPADNGFANYLVSFVFLR